MKVSFPGNRFVDFYSLWNRYPTAKIVTVALTKLPATMTSNPDRASASGSAVVAIKVDRGEQAFLSNNDAFGFPVAEPASTRMFKNLFVLVAHGPRAFRPSKGCQFHTQNIIQNVLLRNKLKYRPLRSGPIRPSSSSSRTPKQTNSWGR
ncbi:hypothetical protein quinque_011377 [Culex quinquefasciatus]